MPNGKFRYFYDKEEYQRYLNKGKKAVDKLFGKAKSALDGLTNKAKQLTSGETKSEKKTKAKDIPGKVSDKSINGVFFLIPRKTLKKAAHWLADKFGFNKDESDGKISDKPKKDHKYVAKVKTANGKYRYFYDQNEYDAYLKRLEYQKDEPGFMKKIRDIAPDDIFTKEQNMDKVNEDFDPYNPATSENCTNCSAAYELRMRGYDVEAKDRDDKYNGRGDRVYDYFEDAEKLYVNGDGSTSKANEKFERKVWNGDSLSKLDYYKNKKAYEFYTEPQSYSAKGLEKAITDNNPPGSRGFIDVTWNGGGGHSIVYEVDNSGKVTIRDSQTYDKYDTSELASKVSSVSITRTDNLQVKKDITNAVVENTDGKRDYYVDEGEIYRK